MNILVPPWFYGFDSFTYFLGGLIGFLLSFYFYKIHFLSSARRHKYLYFGFFLLSTALAVLAISSVYSYLNFAACQAGCKMGSFDDTFSLEDFSYIMYFGFSLLAYIMFIFAYEHEKIKFSKIFSLLFVGYLILISALLGLQRSYKIWHSYSEYFHLTALIMLLFVSFRAFINFDEKRNASSFLVMTSFGFIALFHLLYMLSSVNRWMYVFSHVSLLAGFITLLFMVVKVRSR